MTRLKKITKRNYKKACLLLWERLSKYPYKFRTIKGDKENIWGFKERQLAEVGYEDSWPGHGCPLCVVHYPRADCPLGKCSNYCACEDYTRYSYMEWVDMTNEYEQNNTRLAKKFYKELKEIL